MALLAVAALVVACDCGTPNRIHGTRLVEGAVRGTWVSPGGAFVATLTDPAPSGEVGAPKDVDIGALALVAVDGGPVRRLGGGVTTLPGALSYSRDGRRLSYLADYQFRKGEGELRVVDTTGGEPQSVAERVTFHGFSADGKALVYVASSDLYVKQGDAAPVLITKGVSLFEAGPAGTPSEGSLLVKRRAREGGALLRYDLASGRLAAIAHGVGSFGFSPDGAAVAFAAAGLLAAGDVEPDSPFAPKRKRQEVSGLYLLEDGSAPRLVTPDNVIQFAFSSLDKRFAFVGPPKGNASIGDLFVVDGSAEPRRVEPRVQAFRFAPDGTLALLGAWETRADAGTLGEFSPGGDLHEIARTVKHFSLTGQGRFLLFTQAVARGNAYSIAFLVHEIGTPPDTARELATHVAGYDVSADDQRIVWKSGCTDAGHACTLYTTELGKKEEPVEIGTRIAAMAFAPGDQIVVVSSRRADKYSGDLIYELGVISLDAPGARRVLDDQVTGDFALAGPDRRQVVYTVSETGRPGLYAAHIDASSK